MSNYFICCQNCMEAIAKIDTNAARMWMELCHLHMNYGEYLTFEALNSREEEKLALLERLGYIITTEHEHDLIVNLKGFGQTNEGERFICLKRGRHE